MTQDIKTKRLNLRPILASDATDIAQAANDLDVSRWLTHVPHPYVLVDAKEFISKNEGLFPQVAVIEHEGTFAGIVGVRRELGYWLSKPMWGKGIAFEASEAMLCHHFGTRDASEIASGYFLGNVRSRKILELLRFSNVSSEQVIPRSTGLETTVQKMRLTRRRWEATQ